MTGEGIVPHVDDGIVGMSLGGSVVMHVCWGWRRSTRCGCRLIAYWRGMVCSSIPFLLVLIVVCTPGYKYMDLHDSKVRFDHGSNPK